MTTGQGTPGTTSTNGGTHQIQRIGFTKKVVGVAEQVNPNTND